MTRIHENCIENLKCILIISVRYHLCATHEMQFTKMMFSITSIFQVDPVRGGEQRTNPASEGLQSDINENAVAHVTSR